MEIVVNGESVPARAGEMILDVVRRQGIDIPTLCRVDGLCATGACRLCVVEVAGQERLLPSCATPVSDGMEVSTHSPRAVAARKTLVELLLASHVDDCLYCGRNGSCQLQELAVTLGIRERRGRSLAASPSLDLSSPAIFREPAKCVLCGKCVRVCEEIQGVAAIDFIGRGSRTHVGPAFDDGLNASPCVHCGQCVAVCPTGALQEQNHLPRVEAALADPALTVVVQHAPAVSVSLGEAFGLPLGADVAGHLCAALRRMGFDRVFDTAFAADLTVMEEGSELVARLGGSGPLPMLTSCSPGWIRFVEQFYPQLVPHLSTCKSPQQMLGAVVKGPFAEANQSDPGRIFSVAIMPCTAKKFEATRPEMVRNGRPDIDAVLTTRELAELVRRRGLELAELEPEGPDTPFGQRSSAGKLFGASGGVMEAALRTAHYLVTGEEMAALELPAVRGLAGRKEAHIQVGDRQLGVAVVSGLQAARELLDEVVAGRRDLHFIEVMTCPGGCINGGGQPRNLDREAVTARLEALYAIDERALLRTAHDNREVQRLYEEYLGTPLSRRAHELLHTHYGPAER